jgi:hypothetical protein
MFDLLICASGLWLWRERPILWVKTLSLFLPSLLISSVVCPSARTGANANTLANSHAFRIVILPCPGEFSADIADAWGMIAHYRGECPAETAGGWLTRNTCENTPELREMHNQTMLFDAAVEPRRFSTPGCGF